MHTLSMTLQPCPALRALTRLGWALAVYLTYHFWGWSVWCVLGLWVWQEFFPRCTVSRLEVCDGRWSWYDTKGFHQGRVVGPIGLSLGLVQFSLETYPGDHRAWVWASPWNVTDTMLRRLRTLLITS